MPQEINLDHQRVWSRWKKTAIEWLGVIVAGCSTVISIIAMFITAICIGMIIAMNARIEELSDQVGVMHVYITQHKGKDHE